ncbi:sacsin N-terminal ATP-binding-like domain-containing protein, partial [Streptomyces pilosus]
MSKYVRPAAEGADPFGTARLRRGVLDAWATSPARFREDANAEEDLVLGGYRDRLVVELAQNAADAAARAGVPGRLRLTLRDGVLVAANTGAPLDAAGVESLSTLRASAKRDAPDRAVGRFGVGFAAVLAVTDEPAVVGRHGGVRWSLAEARDLANEAAGQSAGLGDEIRRRDGHVPLLRLPFAAEGTAPAPYDTAVILPLRDTAAADLAERLLDAVDDALLLALPGLEDVVVEIGDAAPRTVRRRDEDGLTVVEDSRDGVTRWRTAAAHGPLTPDLLADRPVEERLRPHWSVTWAVPVDADGSPARPRTGPVVHAPTPSDEPLGVPALLIVSLPLDSTRRHAAPGPLTDFLVQRAADAYAELLAGWRPVTDGIIGLVPGPLGKGELDGALRRAILDRLPRTSFLPPALPPGGQEEDESGLPESLRPRDAEVVEGAGADTVRVLAEVLPTLLPAGLERRAELRTLGVARVPLTDAIDRLAGLEKSPDWWRRLYDSLAGIDADRLSGLPVPLTGDTSRASGTGGGRTTIGPRQVLLPTPDSASLDAGLLVRLGLKVAHPDAVHPLLEKLGALPATPRAVLTTPQVRAAVAASLDDDGASNWE